MTTPLPTLPTYGGANRYFKDSTCPRCEASIDRHGIPGIRPSPDTTNLAITLQDLLTVVDITAILKDYDLGGTSTMVGAAHAVFCNSSACDYVTVSGPGVVLLAHINRGRLGKDVVIVNDRTACDGKGALPGMDGRTFVRTRFPVPEGKVAYPIGSCAAQKLLARILRDAQSKRGVAAIQMSEIMWRPATLERVGQQSRQWSTGHVVPPCDTCMQVLPQMLCDRHG